MLDNDWAWRIVILTGIALVAWLLKSSIAAMAARVDRLDNALSDHVSEDRTRFDEILKELGQVIGKLDILIKRDS